MKSCHCGRAASLQYRRASPAWAPERSPRQAHETAKHLRSAIVGVGVGIGVAVANAVRACGRYNLSDCLPTADCDCDPDADSEISCRWLLFSEQESTLPRRTRAHEDREPDWERWVRRAAADICALRRSAPTWAPAPSLFSEQRGTSGIPSSDMWLPLQRPGSHVLNQAGVSGKHKHY